MCRRVRDITPMVENHVEKTENSKESEIGSFRVDTKNPA